MVLDRRLTIHFANGVMSEILGHTDTPLESGNLDDYLADGSEPFTFEQLAAPPLSGGLREPLVREVVRKTGELRTVRMSGNRFRDSGGEEKIVVQALDITDRLRIEEEKQQLEAQLIHAQKMEAIGTLAGGIAHDFNNLLMGIQGRLSMIRLQSKPDQAHYRHIDPIEKTIYSAAGLTRQLLGFARKGPYEIKPVCLNTLVEESTRMFISTRKEIRLVLRCVPEVWTVRADRGQIEQVMVNLYVNAWQAMPDGGELTIETSNVTLGEDAGRSLGTKPGNYVRITVADTGVGMEPEIMERIFEPFFTTKGMGIGTGLGLASAYGIVKNHKGVITVDSQKGKGTTFTVYLPADTSTAVSTPGRSTAAETPKKGRGRILVVDDEQEFIATAELMLAELGYEVISARSGEEALETYRENRDRLDLVTLDMIMPGMSGKETLEQLKRFDPNVRVLLISGYSRNLQDDELIRRSGGGLLQKPFDLYTLSRKLEELLRG
jgi:PAS domain S-box-containing protein